MFGFAAATFCRLCLKHQSSPYEHDTCEVQQVAWGDEAKLKAIREANYTAYQNSLKERYRTRRRTTDGPQSLESADKDDRHVNHFVPKK